VLTYGFYDEVPFIFTARCPAAQGVPLREPAVGIISAHIDDHLTGDAMRFDDTTDDQLHGP
jgi:hypothetical protein